jgi:hypothetical protein
MNTKIALCAVLISALVDHAQADTDWSAVGDALGKPGAAAPSNVYRIGLPRSDLEVTLDGVKLKPALALGSWLAFRETSDREAIAMGDLVLMSSEVNPVMMKLVENGIMITALHNHLIRSEPPILYMHVMGHGDPVKLAAAFRSALQESRTPLAQAPSAPAPVAALELDTPAIDRILGYGGKANGGVYQVSVPRGERITDHGMEVPEAMGSAIAINFQPTGNGKAAITGDFVLIASEVNPVLRTLRENGIEVTAVHNHMLDDEPRLFFMHFWANDKVEKLATGLRAALDKVHLAGG